MSGFLWFLFSLPWGHFSLFLGWSWTEILYNSSEGEKLVAINSDRNRCTITDSSILSEALTLLFWKLQKAILSVAAICCIRWFVLLPFSLILKEMLYLAHLLAKKKVFGSLHKRISLRRNHATGLHLFWFFRWPNTHNKLFEEIRRKTVG